MLQYLLQFLPASFGLSPEQTAAIWTMFLDNLKATLALTWARYESNIEVQARREYLDQSPGTQYRFHIQHQGGHRL